MSGLLSLPYRPRPVIQPVELARTQIGMPRPTRDLPLPADPGFDTRLTQARARSSRQMIPPPAQPLTLVKPPFEIWMRRLCWTLAASAITIAGAILGAAWLAR